MHKGLFIIFTHVVSLSFGLLCLYFYSFFAILVCAWRRLVAEELRPRSRQGTVFDYFPVSCASVKRACEVYCLPNVFIDGDLLIAFIFAVFVFIIQVIIMFLLPLYYCFYYFYSGQCRHQIEQRAGGWFTCFKGGRCFPLISAADNGVLYLRQVCSSRFQMFSSLP